MSSAQISPARRTGGGPARWLLAVIAVIVIAGLAVYLALSSGTGYNAPNTTGAPATGAPATGAPATGAPATGRPGYP